MNTAVDTQNGEAGTDENSANGELGAAQTTEELLKDKEDKNQKRLLRQRMQFRDERDMAQTELNEKNKELEFMRGRLASLEQTEAVNNKPKIEDFATDTDFMEALTDWKLDQRELAKQKPAAKPAATNQPPPMPQYVTDGLKEMNEAGMLKYDDFSEVINEKSLPFTAEIVAALVMQENSEDLFYHLASNPEELKAIANKSGFQAAKEVYKLHENIKKGTTKLTQAPNPISPLSGGNGGKVPLDDLPVKDWIKRRNKEKGINQ